MDIKNLGNLPFKQNPQKQASEEEVVKNKARGKVIKK